MSARSLVAIFLILATGCAKAPFLAKAKTAEDAYQECHRYSEKKDYDEAIQCFEVLKSRYQGTGHSAEADLEIADNYYRKKDYLVAAEAYKAFATFHPTHEKMPYAYYRAGMCYFKESPKAIDRDQKYLEDALHYLDTATQYVDSEYYDLAKEKAREVRRKLAARHFYVGKFYFRTKEYRAAIPRFNEIVTHYTDLGFDEKALFLMGESYRRLDIKDKSLEVLGVLEQHFPNSPHRKKLAGNLGVR